MNNFWTKLQAPIFALAPMEDVTDTVFREVVLSVSDAKILKVLFTEFTSVDGLLDHRGHDKVAQRLIVSDSEKIKLKKQGVKLVAQIWGNEPEKFYQVARYLTELELFDGIDINMGCPVKKVIKKNTCSALIKFPDLAKEIIAATRQGTHLPVSVKTRIGFNTIDTENWISHLLEMKPAAITIHGRTQKQQSDGLADWSEIQKAVRLRNSLSPVTKILGNGDVDSYTNGMQKISDFQVDGVMVGRGIFKNPWMFNPTLNEINTDERLHLLSKHIKTYQAVWSDQKSFNLLKRFFKIYVQQFDGASTLRASLMDTRNTEEALEIISSVTADLVQQPSPKLMDCFQRL